MTLSNAVDIVFLAATVPALLRVNHDRNGRTADGRPDSDDGNRGKQPWVAFPLKRLRRSRVKLHGACIGPTYAYATMATCNTAALSTRLYNFKHVDL